MKSEMPRSLPSSQDRGNAGLKGLFSWLQQQGLPVVSFRKRFDHLRRNPTMPERGNVLILSLPVQKEILQSEWSALSNWIDQGNTLLILASVYSKAAWQKDDECICEVKKFLQRFYAWKLRAGERPPDEEVQLDTNTLKGSIDAIKAGIEAHTPYSGQLAPRSAHSLLAGVEQVESDLTPYLLADDWSLTSHSENNLALELLEIPEQKSPTLWLMNANAGQIILSLTSDLFSNARLNQADNAQFFVNLLSRSLSAQGWLLFDDYHFGLSDLYDPDRFFSDSRLHWTIAGLFLFWLFYVVGYTERLAPVRAESKRLSAHDSLEVLSGFLARRLDKRLLAEELVKHLIEDLARRRRFRDEQEVWKWLERQNRVGKDQLELLTAARKQQKVPIKSLTDTISSLRTLLL